MPHVSTPSNGSAYIDRNGSSLVIESVGGLTELRIKTDRPLSDEQKDLFEWCALNPHFTWIAPEFRSK